MSFPLTWFKRAFLTPRKQLLVYEALIYIPDARVAAPACKHVPVRHDARSRMDHLVAHIVFDALIVDWHPIGVAFVDDLNCVRNWAWALN